MSNNLIVEAADTLFFRDGRPFTMGEDSQAGGVSIPPPSVLHGALRTAFIASNASNQLSLEKLIELSEPLVLQRLWLHDESEDNFYLPMPKDVVVAGIKKDEKVEILQLEDTPQYSSKKTPKMLVFKPKDDKRPKLIEEEFLICKQVFRNYLNGNFESINVQPLSNFVQIEAKIGIGRNNDTRLADNGMLYRVLQTRPKKDNQSLSYAIQFEGIDLPPNTCLQLGGEKKVAFTKLNSKTLSIDCPVLNNNECRFKIYLSTPAYFESGWEPTNLLSKYNLNLITAVVGKPLQLGGWDVQIGEPKPMWQAVPAGSVYYVEAQSPKDAELAAKNIHETSISDNLEWKVKNKNRNFDLRKQGFGIAYIGRI